MITVTTLAEGYIQETLDAPANGGKFIRIIVNRGGCAGFEYDLVLDNTIGEDDHVFDGPDYRVVFDHFAGALIEGSQLDFNENLIGRGFLLRNPNAEVTCGCGTSFDVKPRRSRMRNMRSQREDQPRTE